MPGSFYVRVFCSLIAFMAGIGMVRHGWVSPQGASRPEAPGPAPAAFRGDARPAHRSVVSPPKVDESEAAGDICDHQRQELLEYGVRAARAEFRSRYGSPPATSLPPPSNEEIESVFPDALASMISCEPPPCRLSIANRARIENFQGLPEKWGYPNGVVRAGTTKGGVYLFEFAFVEDELSQDEWKFVRNAWSFDKVHLDEILSQLEDGDRE